MSEPLAIEVDATHLYPGARGRFADGLPAAGHPVPCALVFSDLARADAAFTLTDAGAGQLTVAPYVTRAGTRIAAKIWLVSLAPRMGGPALRIEARIS